MLKILDLCSGIGGFSLGLESTGHFETVAFCEQDTFCQQILKKHWPHVPVFDDIKELNGHQFRGTVDVVCGGIPCQPFSVAGRKKGTDDNRHLWPDMLRIVKQAQPAYVLIENVANFVNMALDTALSDLEAENYTAAPFVIPACAVDAPHRRDRLWILAANAACIVRSTQSERQHKRPEEPEPGCKNGLEAGSNVADTKSIGIQGLRGKGEQEPDTFSKTALSVRDSQRTGFTSSSRREQTQSGLGGKTDGISFRLDGFTDGWEDGTPRLTDRSHLRAKRIKALGNAVVPQIIAELGKTIISNRRKHGS